MISPTLCRLGCYEASRIKYLTDAASLLGSIILIVPLGISIAIETDESIPRLRSVVLVGDWTCWVSDPVDPPILKGGKSPPIFFTPR